MFSVNHFPIAALVQALLDVVSIPHASLCKLIVIHCKELLHQINRNARKTLGIKV